MLKNEKNIDEKVDVWSFGVILWELVTRQIPFDGMEPFAVAFQVASGNLRVLFYFILLIFLCSQILKISFLYLIVTFIFRRNVPSFKRSHGRMF